MPHQAIHRSKPAAAVAVILLLAALLLAACGGSSGKTTSGATASASASGGGGTTPSSGGSTSSGTSTSGTSTNGSSSGTSTGRPALANRFAKVRECLQKEGVTLPSRRPGQRPRGFLGGAGGPALPKGMTRAQYEAIVKKCGGSGTFGGASRLENPAFKQALASFATCLRANGIDVPQPNTSGKGPIFDTKGIDTASAKFKAAEKKCSASLRGAFRRPPGAAGAAPGAAG